MQGMLKKTLGYYAVNLSRIIRLVVQRYILLKQGRKRLLDTPERKIEREREDFYFNAS